MTIPAERKPGNIERSVFRHIRDAFAIPNGMLDEVAWGDDAEFRSDGKDRWVALRFITSGAGRKSSSLLQADVVTRVRAKGVAGADRFGYGAKDLAHLLYAAMSVDTIQLHDWSDPSSPVLLARRTVMVQNSSGVFREPEETQEWPPDTDGLQRVTMTWRLRLPGDAADKHSYRN